jgi:predicted dehydrogenase
MVFNYRFFDHSQLAQRLVSERDFGRVLNVTALVHYACWSHCIDLIHFFAGPLAEVSALSSRAVRDMGWLRAQDVMAAFRTEDDATGTLIGTTALAWDFPLFELSFNFERGRIRMQDLDGDMEVMDARGLEVERYHISGARSRWDQYNRSFVKSVQAYLKSVRNGQPPPVPGLAGLLELQVEAGLKRSIAQSRPVRLADEFPL